jgi:hypothetical protein
MIWLAPWAWLGLAAIAVPIAVHLIGRRRPTHLAFPTLRFLPETRLAVRTRRRIHDPWLMALRIAILAAAVAALAGPRWLRGGASTIIARAIVVDDSASMSRPTAAGRDARTEAREIARRLASETATARIIEADHLRSGFTDALGWLGQQSGRREIVLISDFQVGAIDDADAARVPAEYGIRVERVHAQPPSQVDTGAIRVGDSVVDVRLDLEPTRMTVAWTRRGAANASPELLESVPDTWTAIVQAAAAVGVPDGPATRRVGVSTTGPAGGSAEPAPWMFEVIEQAHRAWGVVPGDASPLRFVVPAPATLVAVVDPSIDALRAARLFRVLTTAAVDRPPVSELEPNGIPEATTLAWVRGPGDAAGRVADGNASDARWLWLVVLILLGAEWLVRRRDLDAAADRSVRSPEARGHHARVA